MKKSEAVQKAMEAVASTLLIDGKEKVEIITILSQEKKTAEFIEIIEEKRMQTSSQEDINYYNGVEHVESEKGEK